MKQAGLDTELEQRLRELAKLVARWTGTVSLVSKREVDVLWTRHVLDSLKLVRWIPEGSGPIGDFGTGGGFPGLVLAAALPNRPVTLFEADRRKAAFLSEAKRHLCLENVVVRGERIETVMDAAFDVITARAFAPLSLILELGSEKLASGGTLVLLKGADYQRETDAARVSWTFDARVQPSVTAPSGRILIISSVERRSSG